MTAVLYILMRNDLDSMNAGKAIAQGSHASNAFVHDYHRRMQSASAHGTTEYVQKLNAAFTEWENSTAQGFGTVLVLEGSWKEIEPRVDLLRSLGYIADKVYDPTYPIVDGSVVHHIPLHTCAYVFVPNKETDTHGKTLMGLFPLHH